MTNEWGPPLNGEEMKALKGRIDPEKKGLVISFSGGETSAEMTLRLLHKHGGNEAVRVVFANTSFERDETLEFVDRCDRELFAPLGTRVVWVEPKVFHGQRKGSGFRITDFHEAARDGQCFEEVVKKYGIPNQAYPHCTRELKVNPIKAYAQSQFGRDYITAIGIRADEIDRMSLKAMERGEVIYPLVKWGVRKVDVNEAFSRRSFRLNLRGYQGNCKTCWKKTKRKHFTLMKENIRDYDFFDRLEMEYGLVGGEFSKEPVDGRAGLREGYRRVFFRGGVSTKELIDEFEKSQFVPFEDDAMIFPDPELDLGGGCGETCEVFSDED